MKQQTLSVQFVMPAMLSVGQWTTAQILIENLLDRPLEPLHLKVILPQTLVLLRDDDARQTIEHLAPGECRRILVELLVFAGGRRNVEIRIGQEQWKFPVDTAGRGVYSGDNHTHTTYSDSGSTPQENAAGAYGWNNSWLWLEDHNNDEQKEALPGVASQYGGAFLPLAGTEITTGYVFHPTTPSGEKHGHALTYNYPGVPRLEIAFYGGAFSWQDSITQVTSAGGLFFLAHPYDPNYPFETPERWRNYTGIEVWNGSFHALDCFNRRAFDLWDRSNIRGERHYAAICGTDAHSGRRSGSLFTRADLKELSQSEVLDAMAHCRCCGGNGPDCTLRVNGATLGQTVALNGQGSVTVDYEAFTPYDDLVSVKIFCCPVTGVDQEAETVRKVVLEKTLSGGWAHGSICVPVEKPCFFRMEVTSGRSDRQGSPICEGKDPGFAFTNPIWVTLDGTEKPLSRPVLSYDGVPLAITQERYGVRSVTVQEGFDPGRISPSAEFIPVPGDRLHGILDVSLPVGQRMVLEHLLVRKG